MTIAWWRWAALILIMGTLVGVWIWVNRGQFKWRQWSQPRERPIRVLDRHWLAPKTCVVLIEVEQERFLLAQSPHALSWQKLEKPSTEPIQQSCKKDTQV